MFSQRSNLINAFAALEEMLEAPLKDKQKKLDELDRIPLEAIVRLIKATLEELKVPPPKTEYPDQTKIDNLIAVVRGLQKSLPEFTKIEISLKEIKDIITRQEITKTLLVERDKKTALRSMNSQFTELMGGGDPINIPASQKLNGNGARKSVCPNFMADAESNSSVATQNAYKHLTEAREHLDTMLRHFIKAKEYYEKYAHRPDTREGKRYLILQRTNLNLTLLNDELKELTSPAEINQQLIKRIKDFDEVLQIDLQSSEVKQHLYFNGLKKGETKFSRSLGELSNVVSAAASLTGQIPQELVTPLPRISSSIFTKPLPELPVFAEMTKRLNELKQHSKEQKSILMTTLEGIILDCKRAGGDAVKQFQILENAISVDQSSSKPCLKGDDLAMLEKIRDALTLKAGEEVMKRIINRRTKKGETANDGSLYEIEVRRIRNLFKNGDQDPFKKIMQVRNGNIELSAEEKLILVRSEILRVNNQSPGSGQYLYRYLNSLEAEQSRRMSPQAP